MSNVYASDILICFPVGDKYETMSLLSCTFVPWRRYGNGSS